ncbi:MAG TPA: TIM barrel protein [Chloroflexota bacterium]|nr:TIM barrel protein [Chloroflexota bacterium]
MIRVAFVGVGHISRRHFTALAKLRDQAEVVAVCDVVEERARTAAESAGARPYLSFPLRTTMGEEALVMNDPLLGNFAVVTDEVHPDLETAVRAIHGMGVGLVEIQEFWGKTVVEVTDADLDRAGALLQERGMRVAAIGSQLFKPVRLGHVRRGEVARDPHFQQDLDLLRGQIRVARALGAPVIRAYAFRRDDMVGLGNPSPRLPRGGPLPDQMLEKIAQGLRIAAALAADAGLILGLENVRSCWANSGHNTGQILGAVDHPALQAIWDPGNDYVSGGQPYPEGYQAVRGRVCHVHVKDAHVVDHATGLTAWDAVGRGEVDYVAQFGALRRDGYAGTLALETHWHPTGPGGEPPDKIRDSQISFEGVERVLAASLAGGASV